MMSRLYGRTGWLVILLSGFIAFIVFPILTVVVPQDSAFHISQYWVTLIGKIMCYAIVAIAMDLVWG